MNTEYEMESIIGLIAAIVEYLPHTLLDIISKHFAHIILCTRAHVNHLQHPIGFQKYIVVRLYRLAEHIVGFKHWYFAS